MDMISVFSMMVSNPISRMAIKKLLEKDDGKTTKLDKFLKAYAYGEKVENKEFEIIRGIIEKGVETFGYNQEELKKNLRDPYWRNGFANVLRGIAEFGVHKPFVSGAPFLVVWDITYACNLHCKHCYSTSGIPWKDELNTEEALKAVDVLADAGVTIIAFSGGEPLVRRDFFQIARYAADKGMFVAVATNGTLITKDMAKKMKESGIGYVQISLDGKRETYEEFRGVKGIYDKVVEGIINTKEAGIITCISTTATKLNIDDIPAVMDLAEELNVDWFTLYNFIPTGRGGFELDLSPEEKERLLRMLWEREKTTKGTKFVSTAPYYARVALQDGSDVVPTHLYNVELDERLKSLADFIGGCGCGRFYLAMKANGDIQPCVFFPLKLANIKDFKDGDDFLTFWKENKVLNDLRDKDKITVCSGCKYRYVCGGCRARAYAYYRDYLAPDPGCIIADRMIKNKRE